MADESKIELCRATIAKLEELVKQEDERGRKRIVAILADTIRLIDTIIKVDKDRIASEMNKENSNG